MGRLTLVLVMLAGCKKSPPVPAPETVEVEEDPFSPAQLQAWTDTLVPLLEAHAERRFQTPPKVAVFDPRAFQAYLQRETKLILDATLADTPPELRAKAASERGAIAGLFGKYGLYDRTTYVVPASIERAAAQVEVDPVDLGKLVLVHELAHALQNDGVDVEHVFDDVVDLDHFRTWGAVSEGGANWLALQVARDLQLEDAFWTLAGLQGWGREGLEEPSAYPIWMSYGRGMQTLDAVVQDGGMRAFWRWHEAPPVSSSMLFAPSTYSTELPPRQVDLAAVLRGTEQLLTRGEWLVSNTRLGEYELRGDAIRTGKEADLAEVLAHLEDAQHLDLTMSAPTARAGDIRVLRFDSAEAAATYVALLRAEQTIEGQALAKAYGVPVEVTYDAVEGVEGDASLLRTQRVPSGSNYLESRTAWVARGPLLVAVTAERFRPGLRLAQTLNGVFERLDAGDEE